ncbi:hypothetical protein BGX29_012270 [Mortierella sp. GBA35]|nr:hypothetical protein BGX29_012270 [Mortierella sp. GBA35]
MGLPAADYLLLNLAVQSPRIKSFNRSAVVVAFPALQWLSVNKVLRSNTHEIDKWEIFEHRFLTWLKVEPVYRVVEAGVRFPKVQEINGCFLAPGSFIIQKAMKAFPVLRTLRVSSDGMRPGSFVSQNEEEETEEEYPVHPAKALSVCGIYSGLVKIFEAISHMPFLVRLEINRINASNLVDISAVCRALEHIRQIYERLTRFKELETIDLGLQSFPLDIDRPNHFRQCTEIPDSLVLSLGSGFAVLVRLDKLRIIGVNEVNHWINIATKAWVTEHWSMKIFYQENICVDTRELYFAPMND